MEEMNNNLQEEIMEVTPVTDEVIIDAEVIETKNNDMVKGGLLVAGAIGLIYGGKKLWDKYKAKKATEFTEAIEVECERVANEETDK